jgi:tetratricopeptide (TPR) repeat protein
MMEPMQGMGFDSPFARSICSRLNEWYYEVRTHHLASFLGGRVMGSTIFLCCALLGVAGDDQKAGALESSKRAAYNEAASRAGPDAASQVRLALWCEAHGFTAERLKHLGLAILADPASAIAHGLSGLVEYQGKWQRPDDIAKVVQDDPQRQARVKEYLERRAKTPERADDHQKLALWCEQNGLKDQAVAHFHQAIRLDPSREVAWKHLGYKKVGGRWQKPEVVQAQKHEEELQSHANKHWKPLLERWREGLASKDRTRRASAEKGLAEVTDPRAVPAVWTTFALGPADRQKVAVGVLGQIDSPGSSRALAVLALSSRSANVRQHATQLLTRRDPRDFAPFLVGLLRDPIKYEMQKVRGPGSRGELLVKGKDANVKRIYSPLDTPNVAMLPTDRMGVDAYGQPVILRQINEFSMPVTPLAAASLMFGVGGPVVPSQISNVLHRAGLPLTQSQAMGNRIAQNQNTFAQSVYATFSNFGPGGAGNWFYQWNIGEQVQIPVGAMMQDAQRSAEVAEQQLEGDVQAIEKYNAPIDESNKRVRRVLTDSTGVDVGEDRVAWEKWLVDLLGFAYAPQMVANSQPTIVEQVPLAYQPQAVPVVQSTSDVTVTMQHSCFGGGTPVRTIDGLHAIETLRIGDQVLTENPKTGALKYQAVVRVFHNPPNSTLRIELDHESIVVTGIHRLWKAGHGWVMARELKVGDVLRTLGGTTQIKSISQDRKQPVYNLHVAEDESFFVGSAGVLAHDNSLITPTPEPFDAVTLAFSRPKP